MSHQQLSILLALLTPEQLDEAIAQERERAHDPERKDYERMYAQQNVVALLVERELRGDWR